MPGVARRGLFRWDLRDGGGPAMGDAPAWREGAIPRLLAADAEPFFVRAVLPLIGPLTRAQANRPRPLQVGARIIGRGRPARARLRHQLWGTTAGVFLAGATRDRAHRWARRQARRVGGTVVQDPPHGPGRPHFHIVRPDGVRSGHVFWGVPPAGTFFDYDY
jgi:hypothetical protein